jgi:hypothetical protein
MALPARQKRLDGRYALVDGINYKMPIDSWEASTILAIFPCDYEAARKLLPEGDVHPFRLWNKALVVVTVIDYRQTDIGSYIEYSIAVACTRGGKPAPRLLPGLFRKWFGTGQYVHDLPVSTEVSVKGGKGIWGMPKHQASLDYREGKRWVSAQYDLDGQMVTRLDVKRPSRVWLPFQTNAANYCMFRGMIYRSWIYFQGKLGFSLGRGSARFVLGDHPRADALRELGIGADPVAALYIPNVKGLLDDYFECWFVTVPTLPKEALSEGLESTYPLGYGQDRLAPPRRDTAFNLDRD